MTDLLTIVASNALSATGLAGLALIAGYALRHKPAIVHLLWLLVLAKLLTPPVVQVDVMPRWQAPQSVSASAPAPVADRGAALPVSTPVEEAPLALASPPTTSHRAAQIPWLWLWLTGAGSLGGLALYQLGTFRRLVRASSPVDEELARRAMTLAGDIGLAVCPPIRTVDQPLSPLVWSLLGPPQILISRQLLERLTPDELDSVLIHELAHIKRRDHRVRWLELVACTLFWWHPVTWWARRSLRRAEERCCDAWVLRVLPGSERAYAEGLLKTLELTTPSRQNLPALASGMGSTESLQSIEERLIRIMKHRDESPTLPRYRFLLATAVLLALVIFPTWADRAGDSEQKAENPSRVETERLQLQQEALELAEEQLALQARELKAHHNDVMENLRNQLRKAEARLAEHQAAGDSKEIEQLREEMLALQRHAELEAHHHAQSLEALEIERSVGTEMRRLELEAQYLAAQGKKEEALEVRRRLEREAFERQARQMELAQRELERDRAQQRLKIEEMAAQFNELQEAGEQRRAEEVARKLEKAQFEAQRAVKEEQAREQIRALDLEREKVERHLRESEEKRRLSVEAREKERRQHQAELELKRERLLEKLRRQEAEARSSQAQTSQSAARELPHKLQELRHLLESVDTDGTLSLKLDELEAALEKQVAEGWY